jgi:hypothetical protein
MWLNSKNIRTKACKIKHKQYIMQKAQLINTKEGCLFRITEKASSLI